MRFYLYVVYMLPNYVVTVLKFGVIDLVLPHQTHWKGVLIQTCGGVPRSTLDPPRITMTTLSKIYKVKEDPANSSHAP